MDKFVIIEVGSTNTKAYLYKNNELKSLGRKTIEFKNHYKKEKRLTEEDKNKLFSFIASIDEEKIFVYGTSIFRNLSDSQKKEWLHEFKEKTNLDFTIVTPDMENEYTVYGAIANIDYDDKIAIMIGGGGSTELAIVQNGKIIEKANSNFGAMDIVDMFPDIKTDVATTAYETMVEETNKLVNAPKNKADLLILAGGDFIYFYETMEYPMAQNTFYKNPLQPYCLDIDNSDKIDLDFFYNASLDKVIEKTNDEGWWRGSRGMRLCVKAIANAIGAKYIIPTRINMVYGIVNQIKNKQ